MQIKKLVHWISFCLIWTWNYNVRIYFDDTNKEDIFDSFPGIGNVIASDVVLAVSYLHSRDIVQRDVKPTNILVSNSHYESYKYTQLEMAFGKKI